MLNDAVFIAGQFDLGIVYFEFLPQGVEGHRTGTQGRGCPTATAAQQRIHAGGHFLKMKRLDDIVIGAGAQAIHFVLPAIASGQNQDRVHLTLVADLFYQVNA